MENVEIFHYLKYTLALLLFKDKDTATKALKAKEGTLFRNRRLRMHIEYIAIWNIKKNVFVYVVDDNTTEEDVYDKFKTITEVTGVLVFHPLAYVSCNTQEQKEAAIKELNAEETTVYDLTGHDQSMLSPVKLIGLFRSDKFLSFSFEQTITLKFGALPSYSSET